MTNRQESLSTIEQNLCKGFWQTSANCAEGADEAMGSQIFSALIKLGHLAVPALLPESSHPSAWIRWYVIRALGESCDSRALPVLVERLGDGDRSVVWMAAKGLLRFGKQCLGPLLSLLVTEDTSPWLAETASYILRNMYGRDPRLKPYLEPVVQGMNGVAFRIATPQAARLARSQLVTHGLVGA